MQQIYSDCWMSFLRNNTKWEEIGPVCTDGTPSMTGHRSVVTTLIKEGVPDIFMNHCVLHCHALAALTPHLKEVITSVSVCNF